MRGRRRYTLVILLAALVLFPSTPRAEPPEPERRDIPIFEVRLADRDGAPRETFSGGEEIYVDLSFTLALSASRRYATSITLMEDANGTLVEKTLWRGSLEEGHYRFFASAGRPSTAADEITVRVILRTRVFPKKFTGESFYVYRSWEGSYRVGGGEKNGAEGGT